jgi:hypothetical protein
MMTTELKKINLAVPHDWLTPLRKQAFRLQLKIDDFVSLGVVEFIRCLPDAYFDYMDADLPDPLDNEDQTFEVLALMIHQQWSTLLEIEAKTLEVTPLALLYISLLWLADQPEDDEHLLKAKISQSWLAPIQVQG